MQVLLLLTNITAVVDRGEEVLHGENTEYRMHEKSEKYVSPDMKSVREGVHTVGGLTVKLQSAKSECGG